jgi:hypothetical protein
VLSPLVRSAVAAISVGLATVFIPDHSPRALALFLVGHSALGILLFGLDRTKSKQPLQLLGYAAGGLVAVIALVVLIGDPVAAQLASLAALSWSLMWLTHWLIIWRSKASPLLPARDLLVQVLFLLGLFLALVLSFGDPVASTGFVGVYLVAAGMHLAIVAASPKVG